jgi:LPXTG-motif cell wall-anchored protein
MFRLVWLFLWTSPLFALVTAYVSFDTPEGWRCELAQGVWICQSGVETHRKDSVVLSIATLASDWDSLDNYENYLKQPRPIQDEDGKTLTSKVSYVRKRNVNGIIWVDSLQFNSELPGFWARYLATVHATGQTKLAILITYIVSDEKYSMFAPQFERMVASLKPNADFDLNILSKQGDGPLPGSQRLGSDPKKMIFAERLNLKKRDAEQPRQPATNGGSSNLVFIVAGIAALGGYLFIRSRRKKKVGEPPSEG